MRTRRAWSLMGGRTVAQAARECGLSWPVVHAAFAARADPVLEQPPSLVAHLGIDEHRRGRPRWLTDEGTGEYVLLADRWHTCFFDLSGDQCLPGQRADGRQAAAAAYPGTVQVRNRGADIYAPLAMT